MYMLWNFSALEYSRCLAIPLGLLSLSTLNSFLSVPKPSAPWTSMAVSFQHPLSCLSQRPSPRLKGPLTAHIPPPPAPSLAAAQPWSLPVPFPQLWSARSTPSRTFFAHDSRCLNSVWTSPVIFRLASTTRNSKPNGRPPFFLLSLPSSPSLMLKAKEEENQSQEWWLFMKREWSSVMWCVSD